MLQVSRDSNLKIPKKLESANENVNSVEDKMAVKEAFSTAENQKFNFDTVKQDIEDDKDLEYVSKIPYNSNDLMVITVVKKLGAYTLL